MRGLLNLEGLVLGVALSVFMFAGLLTSYGCGGGGPACGCPGSAMACTGAAPCPTKTCSLTARGLKCV